MIDEPAVFMFIRWEETLLLIPNESNVFCFYVRIFCVYYFELLLSTLELHLNCMKTANTINIIVIYLNDFYDFFI